MAAWPSCSVLWASCVAPRWHQEKKESMPQGVTSPILTRNQRVIHVLPLSSPPTVWSCLVHLSKSGRMRDYLIAFVLCFIGSMAIGPITAALGRWADKRFPPIAQSHISDPVEAFPQVWRLRTAVYSVCLAWASILSVVFV